MEKLFENIGKTLKLLSKILFYSCLAIGIVVIVIGAIRFLSGIDEYTTFADGLSCTLEDALKYENLYADCYYGRQMVSVGFVLAISSLSTLIVYGFGEIIDKISIIASNTNNGSSKSESQIKKDQKRLAEIEKLRLQDLISEEEYQQILSKNGVE